MIGSTKHMCSSSMGEHDSFVSHVSPPIGDSPTKKYTLTQDWSIKWFLRSFSQLPVFFWGINKNVEQLTSKLRGW